MPVRPRSDIEIGIPDTDMDVVLRTSHGGEITIQYRPSNALVLGEDKYKGSIDIILSEDRQLVTFRGDDLQPSVRATNCLGPHSRVIKQIVMELF